MLNISNVIICPILSEKSNQLVSQNKYVFKVNVNCNKIQIKEAVEKRFGVKVNKVATMNFKGKIKNATRRSSGNIIRTKGRRSNWKKAIVSLVDGSKIDLVEGDF